LLLLVSKRSSLDGYHYNEESIEIQKAATGKKGGIVLLVQRKGEAEQHLRVYSLHDFDFPLL
jgi:hypothetical protein